MQRSLLLLTIVAGATTTVQAQAAWQTEIGIQGGFTRVVAAGANADATDAITLPGFNLANGYPAPAGFFAIIPLSEKAAVEADVAASQLTIGATLTLIGAGLRGNYAVTKNVYAAAGGAIAYNNGGTNETQLGFQGALGYRFHLTGALGVRFEGRATFYGKADNGAPLDLYSFLFGVSTATGRARSTGNASTPASNRAWKPQIGIAGGYTHVHFVGSASVTSLSFPGYGAGIGIPLGALNSIFYGVTLPPTVFAIIPIGSKVAVEPGFDLQRVQTGTVTDFTGNLSARLDYAVHGGWYGALGGNLHYIKPAGVSAATRPGVNLAWGYRFPLALGVGGRVEANYTWFGRNTDFGLPPTNVFGLMFGAAMLLK